MLTCSQHKVSALRTETLGDGELVDLLLQDVRATCQSERAHSQTHLQASSAQPEC